MYWSCLPIVLPQRSISIWHADGVGAGGAQPGPARRDVGDRGDLQAAVEPQQLQRLADQLVLELVGPLDHLRHGVAGADLVVELAVDGDIDVFVDRRANHRAGLARVERGHVAAAADEADPQGCP
jgi:hypothetical protein